MQPYTNIFHSWSPKLDINLDIHADYSSIALCRFLHNVIHHIFSVESVFHDHTLLNIETKPPMLAILKYNHSRY